MKRTEFIEKVAQYAVADYNRSKILPSLTIAQAILESGWGKSGLAVRCNNLFGIKGKYQGQGEVFPTKEFMGGKWITIEAEFRKYPTFEGSIRDHNDLLQKPRYKKVKGEKDYKKACHAIKEAGYATDPNYPALLIDIIERLKLNKYDEQVVGYMMSKADADAIIKILQEKYAEGVARKDESMKKDAARLANEVRKASGQKIQ